MQRYDWLKQIRRLDPERDFLRIYRITAAHEFPWDITRALELALYRTYAVPRIGRLLAETAELTRRTQKRYDDTALLLDAVLEHGFDGADGRTAIRRMNQMHRSYDIGNDDMRYVLSTFVVVPQRWIDQYGWRRLSEHEKRAIAAYYRTLGRHMGITEIPQTFEDFERFLDAYEAAHFGWDEGARKVSDATLDLMAGWYGPLAPLVRGASMALLDDTLLDAFRYEHPRPAVRTAVRGALKLRAKAVRLLPPRRRPHYARQNPEIKGYPNGFRVAELGTFPAPRAGGCPLPHADGPAPR
ncbi:oxygenase MpaB family protein [Streptomyces gilvosporeus]|uniref:Peptidase n=1 Tax=Streptomyces gilvosporeus TaxID=553510 RepID=A0A1V0U0I8_9ACTN|nr:oxygenase MpaB family protein [Streptomyces gilvosporeus]ARF58724.1 peptidase [Streptomyces gilvosporeus]